MSCQLRRSSIDMFFSAIGTATDFICVLVPTFIIRGLQLDKRTKTAMMIVLGLGFL